MVSLDKCGKVPRTSRIGLVLSFAHERAPECIRGGDDTAIH